MFEESYNTISTNGKGIFKDRGSVFTGYAFSITCEIDLKAKLNQLKTSNPNANHYCYAFRLGPHYEQYMYSDDREPSGSAGKPIYGVIRSHELTDILIVVTRTFGGTLLGVPGLINAYRKAAELAIDNSKIITKAITEKYALIYSYDVIKEVNTLMRQFSVTILSQSMTEKCHMNIEVINANADDLLKRIKEDYILKEKCEIKVLQ